MTTSCTDTDHPYYKEKSREHFYLWNKFHQQAKGLPELPFINFETCPLSKDHKKTILDKAGRVRCANQKNFEIHPSFTKVNSVKGLATGTKKIDFFENPPYDDSDFDEDYNEFLIRKHKFDNEEPIQVTDTCYSIIKEPKSIYLPLETILDRINCTPIKGQTVHPFSGFTLADYVHAWWEQSEEKKYWKHDNSIDIYKEFPNFTPIGTDD